MADGRHAQGGAAAGRAVEDGLIAAAAVAVALHVVESPGRVIAAGSEQLGADIRGDEGVVAVAAVEDGGAVLARRGIGLHAAEAGDVVVEAGADEASARRSDGEDAAAAGGVEEVGDIVALRGLGGHGLEIGGVDRLVAGGQIGEALPGRKTSSPVESLIVATSLPLLPWTFTYSMFA